jgi:molybdate transport system ATP-binding protein
MIELDVQLPLARFALSIQARIESEAVAVLGPSGAGKTSLLEVIAGLRRRATGRVVVDGEPLLDTAAGVRVPPERRRIGYVPQDSGLFPHLDARANVRFGLRRERGAEARFTEAVEMLEIGHLLDRYPATLSGGERQRVAIARALASAPRLLLLDEPLAAVDLALRGRILPYLLQIRDEARVPMVHVTHHVGEAQVLAREVLVLEGGRVAAHGPAAAVVAARTLASDPEADLDNVLDGRIAARDEAGGVASLVLAGGGVVLAVPAAGDLPVGSRATYAVPAEDVLVSIAPLAALSARNVFEAAITGIEPVGRDVLVRLRADGVEWWARLTPAATRDLGLAPGQRVWIAVKTHAFRRLR